GIITAIRFALVIFSTFLNFTPISEHSWRAGGVGFPVMLSCIAGCLLAMRKNYFPAFFIGIFAAFFLTHEITIVYDTHAIEIGQELKPDGWFRSVIMVYQDALRPGFGAFWGMIGVILASVTPLIGMGTEVRRKNLEAARLSEKASEDNCPTLSDFFEEEPAETRPDEEATEWAEQFFSDEKSDSEDEPAMIRPEQFLNNEDDEDLDEQEKS
ncbi:MAG: hypothetical protein KKB51_09100, partial [Candidatus Riflebacteria bacterium]|nr:hypothetical protein [Candidatus Riflebacteria bacterium]